MAVITTPGAANANSYATEDEFKAYRINRLPSVASVLTAVDADITVALIVAARSLDANMRWTGSPVDGVQAMTWPRSGMLTRNGFDIPTSGTPSITTPLKDAQCEFAYQLLAGLDLTADNTAASLGVQSVKAGSVAVSFQSFDSSSIEAVDMFIKRLGADFAYLQAVPGEVRRLLVPSWYEEASIKEPLLLEAL